MTPKTSVVYVVRSFVLVDESTISVAVPHKIKYSLLGVPSPNFHFQQAEGSHGLGTPKWIPVFTGGNDFTYDTIVSPRSAALGRKLVRYAFPGSAIPLWSLEYDGMIIVKGSTESLDEASVLALTVAEEAFPVDPAMRERRYLISAVLTDTVIRCDSTLVLPFCSVDAVVVRRVLDVRATGYCVLLCREKATRNDLTITVDVEHVNLASFALFRRVWRGIVVGWGKSAVLGQWLVWIAVYPVIAVLRFVAFSHALCVGWTGLGGERQQDVI
ncbi:hypothetical protein B0H11DRAFT_2226928 [Mycena galericulata]|nr:hypothetical protein B0H11DRAFT_2226928 [Mycena galericulata]